MWAIIFDEGNCGRPEVHYASNFKTAIDKKLEDLKNEYSDFVFDYVEGDCLILKDDSAYYVDKVMAILE